MRLDILVCVLNGLGMLALIVSTVALDTTLLPDKSGYWRRFYFIGLRYGLPGFLVWLVIVFFST